MNPLTSFFLLLGLFFSYSYSYSSEWRNFQGVFPSPHMCTSHPSKPVSHGHGSSIKSKPLLRPPWEIQRSLHCTPLGVYTSLSFSRSSPHPYPHFSFPHHLWALVRPQTIFSLFIFHLITFFHFFLCLFFYFPQRLAPFPLYPTKPSLYSRLFPYHERATSPLFLRPQYKLRVLLCRSTRSDFLSPCTFV